MKHLSIVPFVLLMSVPATAQSPCMSWSGEFALPGFDDTVTSFRTLDDGNGAKLYAVGRFQHVNGIACDRCARFDGSVWTPLQADPTALIPSSLLDIAVFDDGLGGGPALYASGDFALPGGAGSYDGIAKRVSGSWTAIGTGGGLSGGSSVATCLQVFDAGTGPALYVGGDFLWADGITVNRIARWDGSTWTGLGQGIGGASSSVLCLSVYDNGTGPKLYVGGTFTNVDGTSGVNRIAAWDGNAWSMLQGGTSDWVRSMAVYDDGSGPQLYVGGDFASAGGHSCSKIARWNGIWSTLTGSGVSSGAVGFARVDSLVVANPISGPGSTLFVGGNFDSAGGLPANYVAGYRSTGWLPLDGGTNARVLALGAYNPGAGDRLHVATGSQAGGMAVSFSARWNGSAWEAQGLGHGLDGSIAALTSWNDGTSDALYAGGDFQSVAATPHVAQIGRWNGIGWTALGGGIDGSVKGLATIGSGSGSRLYAVGNFHHAGGQSANYIAGWDGNTWAPLGTGLDSQASVMRAFDDGSGPKLYVGGTIASIGAHGVARWNGTNWSTADSGFSGSISAMEVFDDGTGPALYAVGAFVFTGQSLSVGFARWNGSSWTALANTMGGSLQVLKSFDDGTGPKLYLGGANLVYNLNPLGALAVWAGGAWAAFPAPLGSAIGAPAAMSLTVYDDGTGSALYATGTFDSAGGSPALNIARWDGTSWSALASGLADQGRALAVYNDGRSSQADLYVGGIFRSVDGKNAARLASWYDRCATGVGTQLCSGDGSLTTPCPCANFGATGRGCANSINAQGALLEAFGETFPDSLTLHASGMLTNPNISCIFLQGTSVLPQGVVFGDGLRCAGGQLTRLGAKGSPGGNSNYPQSGDSSVSVRGGVVPGSGVSRIYQTYYRDPNPSFCPNPPGNTWNVTSAVQITW